MDLTVTDASALAELTGCLGRRVVRSDASRLTLEVATGGGAPEVRTLLDRIDPQHRLVSRFAVHSAALDDVFLALTGHSTDRDRKDADACASGDRRATGPGQV